MDAKVIGTRDVIPIYVFFLDGLYFTLFAPRMSAPPMYAALLCARRL